MSRLERLRRAPEFRTVFGKGRCFRDKALRIHFLANDLGRGRLGLVVSRKVGGSVVRSRVKRRLRHVFRRHKAELPQALDIVCVADNRHGEAAFSEYEAAFRRFIEFLRSRAGTKGRTTRAGGARP